MSLALTAIPGWLAIDLGAALQADDGGARIPIHLMLAKPFTLTPHLSLVPAIGPELVVRRAAGLDGVEPGGRIACALEYWPISRVGVWIEPAFDVLLRDGLQQYVVGVAAGAQLGFR